MLRWTIAAGFLMASVTAGAAQQQVNGQGKTCTSVNKRCYTLGGNAGICEPKFQQCLQTGTYYGNNNTISSLKKQ
jgi:hypothetical protein